MPTDSLGLALPLDVLHHKVGGARALPEGIDAHHVRVFHRRHRSGFAKEEGAGRWVRGEPRGHHLDGHAPIEGGVLAQIDDAHAALAELAENPVSLDLRDCGRGASE